MLGIFVMSIRSGEVNEKENVLSNGLYAEILGVELYVARSSSNSLPYAALYEGYRV